MLAPPERRRPNAYAVVGVTIYALFLVTAPFEHHDLVCHFKTPTHCTACTSSLVGADPKPRAAAGAARSRRTPAARSPSTSSPTGFLLTVRSTGRSPPAAV